MASCSFLVENFYRQITGVTVGQADKFAGVLSVQQHQIVGKNARFIRQAANYPIGAAHRTFQLQDISGSTGGALLLAFGVGTLPGLLLVGTGASVLSRRYRRHCDIFSGILMIGMAASLLVDAITAII